MKSIEDLNTDFIRSLEEKVTGNRSKVSKISLTDITDTFSNIKTYTEHIDENEKHTRYSVTHTSPKEPVQSCLEGWFEGCDGYKLLGKGEWFNRANPTNNISIMYIDSTNCWRNGGVEFTNGGVLKFDVEKDFRPPKNLTIEVEFEIKENRHSHIFSNMYTSEDVGILFQNTGQGVLQAYHKALSPTLETLKLNKRYIVHYVISDSRWSVYIDGELVKDVTITDFLDGSNISKPLFFGNIGNCTRSMFGTIFSIKVWSKGLRPDEIMKTYAYTLTKGTKFHRDNSPDRKVVIKSGEGIDVPHRLLESSIRVVNGRLVHYKTSNSHELLISNNKTLDECIVEETDDYVIYSDGIVTADDPIPESITFGCRVDKHTGEIYIGRKFTNLCSRNDEYQGSSWISYNKLDRNGWVQYTKKPEPPDQYSGFAWEHLANKQLNAGDKVFTRVEFKKKTNGTIETRGSLTNFTQYEISKLDGDVWERDFVAIGGNSSEIFNICMHDHCTEGETIVCRAMCVVGLADYKDVPYVKSFCPTGRLSFVGQDSTSENHSFITRQYSGYSTNLNRVQHPIITSDKRYEVGDVTNRNFPYDFFVCSTKSASVGRKNGYEYDNGYAPANYALNNTVGVGNYLDQINNYPARSIKGFDIFSGVMTEEEMRAELAKVYQFDVIDDITSLGNHMMYLEDMYHSANSEIICNTYISTAEQPVNNVHFYLGIDPFTKHLVFYGENANTKLIISGNKTLDECLVYEDDIVVVYSDGTKTEADPTPEGISFACTIFKKLNKIYTNRAYKPLPLYSTLTTPSLALYSKNNSAMGSLKQYGTRSTFTTFYADVPANTYDAGGTLYFNSDAYDTRVFNQLYAQWTNTQGTYTTEFSGPEKRCWNFSNFADLKTTEKIAFSGSRANVTYRIPVNKKYFINNICITLSNMFNEWTRVKIPKTMLSVSSTATTSTHTFVYKNVENTEKGNANIIFNNRNDGGKCYISVPRESWGDKNKDLIFTKDKCSAFENEVEVNLPFEDISNSDPNFVASNNLNLIWNQNPELWGFAYMDGVWCMSGSVSGVNVKSEACKNIIYSSTSSEVSRIDSGFFKSNTSDTNFNSYVKVAESSSNEGIINTFEQSDRRNYVIETVAVSDRFDETVEGGKGRVGFMLVGKNGIYGYSQLGDPTNTDNPVYHRRVYKYIK